MYYKNSIHKPGVAIHTYNPNTWETQAGRSRVHDLYMSYIAGLRKAWALRDCISKTLKILKPKFTHKAHDPNPASPTTIIVQRTKTQFLLKR